MSKIKVLLIDGRESGQPDGVLQEWQKCFRHKGFAGCVDVGAAEDLGNDKGELARVAGRFSVVMRTFVLFIVKKRERSRLVGALHLPFRKLNDTF